VENAGDIVTATRAAPKVIDGLLSVADRATGPPICIDRGTLKDTVIEDVRSLKKMRELSSWPPGD
jgi:hypothetical protein